MKILLSGGSGFIGKNLLKYITQNIGYNIMLVGRNLEKIENKKIKQVKLDLNKIDDNFDKIKKFNPDIFLHLAWEGIPDYSEELSKKNYLNTFEEYILGIKLFQYIPKKSIKILSIVDNSIISGKLSKFDHITHIQIDDLSLTIDEICDILQNPNNSDKQDPNRVWEIDRKIKDEIIKELEKKRKTKKNSRWKKIRFKQTRKNIKKEMKELGAESSERGAEFSDIFLYLTVFHEFPVVFYRF